MNNEQNNNGGIVKPQPIETKSTNMEQDNMLNRERENIVSATIQANDAIDEKKARSVNDSIKVKKKNPFFSTLLVLVLLIFAGGTAFLAFKLVNDTIKKSNPTTTTRTTTKVSELEKVMKYINNSENLRKFQDEEHILLLSPIGYDLVKGNNYYLLIQHDKDKIISTSYGVYSILQDELKLTPIDAGEVSYKITEAGITLNGAILKIFDSEVKYYANKTDKQTDLLIINGTLKSEYAMYIQSINNNTNVITSSYMETQESITLENGLQFKKNGTALEMNGHRLTLSAK